MSSSASSDVVASSTLVSAFSLIVDLALVFVSHIGYVVQYIDITRTGNIDGYAPLVSLILLTSNTLRVFYFMGERYALALFFQAVVALFVHSGLLMKVLQVHRAQLWLAEEANAPPLPPPIVPDAMEKNAADDVTKTAAAGADEFPSVVPSTTPVALGSAPAPYHTTDPNEFVLYRIEDVLTERFLRHSPLSFLSAYAVFAAVSFLLILFVVHGLLGVASVVGYCAMGVEAMLVLPQILRNARRKSTEGLTMFLVFTWVFGDLAKLVYFLVKSQPLPFIVCDIVQIMLDAVVLAQLWVYRQSGQAAFLSMGLQSIGSDMP